MNTKLILAGKVYAVATKSFNDEETIYAQFLNKQENGTVDVLKVKMTEQEDIQALKEGMVIKIPIKISSYEGRMFYSQTEALIKG
ncbi:MAG: hypothetical protein WBF48_04950 [Halarcobacter sp.]